MDFQITLDGLTGGPRLLLKPLLIVCCKLENLNFDKNPERTWSTRNPIRTKNKTNNDDNTFKLYERDKDNLKPEAHILKDTKPKDR